MGLVIIPFIVFSQGQVRFNNTSLTLISTNSIVGGPATGTTSGSVGTYYFGLFVASVGTSDPNAFAFTGAYATNTSAGRLNGGNAEISGSTGANSFAIIVRGWSANIGHDWLAVTAYLSNPTFDAWYAESQIGVVQPTMPEGPYPSFFGTVPGAIPGFNLQMYSVPEPSSFAFVGVSAMALWIFRRRSP